MTNLFGAKTCLKAEDVGAEIVVVAAQPSILYIRAFRIILKLLTETGERDLIENKRRLN